MNSPEKSSRPAEAASPPAGRREKSDYKIRKVVQALNLLEQFHDDVDELGLGELSRRLAMKEVSVDRLLATLQARNYIEQNRMTKGYRLGFNNLKMAQTVLHQTDLYRVAHPVLASIAERCGETTSVAVLRKSHVIELDAAHSKHPGRGLPRVGLHLPVHCTSAGKVLIARESDQGLEHLLRGVELASYTKNTLTGKEALKLHLRQVLEDGYGVDDEELDREVRSGAAEIRDCVGRVVGAMAITGPSCRIDLHRLRGELVPLAKEGAAAISVKLGFREADRQPLSDRSRHKGSS